MQNNCLPKNHAHKEWKIIFPLLRIIEWNCPQLSVNNPFSFFSTPNFYWKRKNNNIFWLLLIFMKFTLCATTVLLNADVWPHNFVFSHVVFFNRSLAPVPTCLLATFLFLISWKAPYPDFVFFSLSPQKCSGICLLKMMSWEPAATHTQL